MAELPPVGRIVTTHNASGRSAVQINDSVVLQVRISEYAEPRAQIDSEGCSRPNHFPM